MKRLLAAGLVSALAAVGCRQVAQTPSCVAATDCAHGQICADGSCGPCGANADCAPGLVCTAGACGACTAGAECSGGFVCVSGACAMCTRSDQCEAGAACVSGVCGRCATSDQCAPGLVCTAAGACAACASADDCPAGLGCAAGKCGQCSAASQCRAGLVCKAGACRGCASAGDCATGQACVSGRCGGCLSSADCTGGKICAAGKCAACSTAEDCRAGQACVSGACGKCVHAADCRAGEACVGGACGACGSNADCAAGQACVGGACGQCTAASQCPGGVCQIATGACAACTTDADCGDAVCVSGGCSPCGDGAPCTGGRVCSSGACGACSLAAPCPSGEVCGGDGSCGPCASASQCPVGQICASGACGKCASGLDCGATLGCVSGTCTACNVASDCGGGRVCLVVGGAPECLPCTAGAQCPGGGACVSGACTACASAAPCDPGFTCVAGACRGCNSNLDCGTKACDAQTGRCAACNDPVALYDQATCSSGLVCRADGTCGACDSSRECQSGQICASGTCGPCNTTRPCPSGLFCASGQCAHCQATSQCPNGDVCDLRGASGAAGTCVAGACDPAASTCTPAASATCAWSSIDAKFECKVTGPVDVWPASAIRSFACSKQLPEANPVVGPLTGYVYALGCDGNQGNVQVYALDPASGTVVAQLPLPGAVGGGTAFAPVAYATSGSASEERLVVGLVGNAYSGATELAVLKADVANASFATLWTVPASAVWWAGLAAPDSGGLFLVGVGEAVSGSRAGTELFAVDANAASAPVLIHQTIDNALIGVQRASTVVSGGRIYLTTSSTLSDYGASSGNSPSFLREYVLGGTPPAFSYAWGAPFGSGDLAYRWPLAVTSSTDMLAVDAFDPNGERVLTQGCIPASFPTDGTRATCTNAGLWELDSANGNWTGEVWGSTQRVGPVVIGSDGHVVIGANVQSGNSTKYVVQAFARARPGTPLWTWNVPTLPSGQTAIDPTAATLLLQRDGTVIVQSPNALAEIDPSRLDANGFAATAWVYRPGGPYAPSPFPSYSFGAPFVTAVEDGAGRYFTFYADGTLHALGLPHPSAPDLDAAGKSWPMARHDAGGQQRLGARP